MKTGNLMTEEQAHEAWCPFARPEGGNRPMTGRDGDHPYGKADPLCLTVNCVGSWCAMWRIVRDDPREGEPLGHCGLAGKP